jgi:hypothetical protein
MVERLRNQGVRFDNLRTSAFRWMYGRGVFDWIEGSLSLRGAPEFVIGFGQGNGANPRHNFGLPSARKFA